MLKLHPTGEKRTRGVLLPRIAAIKSAGANRTNQAHAPTGLKEVLKKHEDMKRNRISNGKYT